MAGLTSKPGITNASFGSGIPAQYDQTWFRRFVQTGLQLADVRNAVGTNGITISGNITQYATIGFGAPVTLPGPVTINAPASGGSYTLTVNANTSNQAGILLEGTGGPFLLIEDLGSNQAYMQLQATNASGYLIDCSYGVGSPGNLQFQMGNVTRMTLANTGGLTINAPTSGSALSVTGTGSQYPININAASSGNAMYFSDGTTAGALQWSGSHNIQLGTTGGAGFDLFTNSAVRLTIGSTGAVTIAAPSSAVPALSITGNATNAVSITGNSTIGSSYGVNIAAGTNASDYALRVTNYSTSALLMELFGDNHGSIGPGLAWGAAGNVTIAAPSSSTYSLQVNAPSGNFGGFIQGYGSSGNSFGLLVEAGYTGDNPVYVTNYGNTNLLFAGQGNGSWFFPLVGTTAAAANVTFAAGTYANSILKSTSSIRYKKNVRTLDTSAHLMKLRPVVYNSTAAADDDSVDHLGLVAEEVADVDPRLVHFEPESLGFEPHPTVPKTHVQKFGPKRPDGVQYERLTVLLLDAFQKLRAEVDALKASQK